MSLTKFSISLIWCISIIFSGCYEGKKIETARPGEMATKLRNRIPFLEQIPARTPFLYLSYEPLPPEILQQFKNSAKSMSAVQAAALAAQLDGDASPISEAERFAIAFVLESAKVMARPGSGGLGVGDSPKLAVYGLGLNPIIRVKLLDPDKAGRFIERVLKRARIKSPASVARRSDRVWVHKGNEMYHVLGLSAEDLVFSVHPHSMHDRVMAHIRGQAKAESSLASKGTIQGMIKARQLGGMGLGFIDVEALSQAYLGIGSASLLTSWKAFGLPQISQSEACQKEGLLLAGGLSRIEFGSRLDHGDRFTGFIFLQSYKKLMDSVAKLITPLPQRDGQDKTLFSAGVGLKVGPAIRLFFGAISTLKPLACPDFASINQAIDQLRTVWAGRIAMIPPVLKTLSGLFLEIDQLNLDQGAAAGPRGAVVLLGDRMDALYTLLKTMVPVLASADVKADGKTVPLDGANVLKLGSPVAVNLTQSTFASVMGSGQSSRLNELLNTDKYGPPKLVGLSYDVGRFSESMQTIVERIAVFQGRPKAAIGHSSKSTLRQFTLDLYPSGRELVLRSTVQLR